MLQVLRIWINSLTRTHGGKKLSRIYFLILCKWFLESVVYRTFTLKFEDPLVGLLRWTCFTFISFWNHNEELSGKRTGYLNVWLSANTKVQRRTASILCSGVVNYCTGLFQYLSTNILFYSGAQALQWNQNPTEMTVMTLNYMIFFQAQKWWCKFMHNFVWLDDFI